VVAVTDNDVLALVIIAWAAVQLARILASYLTTRRRDRIKAGRPA
jgi:hypothetical protein